MVLGLGEAVALAAPLVAVAPTAAVAPEGAAALLQSRLEAVQAQKALQELRVVPVQLAVQGSLAVPVLPCQAPPGVGGRMLRTMRSPPWRLEEVRAAGGRQEANSAYFRAASVEVRSASRQMAEAPLVSSAARKPPLAALQAAGRPWKAHFLQSLSVGTLWMPGTPLVLHPCRTHSAPGCLAPEEHSGHARGLCREPSVCARSALARSRISPE